MAHNLRQVANLTDKRICDFLAFMANGQLTGDQVRSLLRAECDKADSAKNWAEKHDLSPAYISDVLQGRREPGMSILIALGLRKIVAYETALGTIYAPKPKRIQRK